MTFATGSRLARAWLTRGAIVTATATALAATAGAARADSLSGVTTPDRSSDPIDAFDLPDTAARPDVGAGTRADLPRLLDEGETAYRARRGDDALAAFQRVVALDPGHAQEGRVVVDAAHVLDETSQVSETGSEHDGDGMLD